VKALVTYWVLYKARNVFHNKGTTILKKRTLNQYLLITLLLFFQISEENDDMKWILTIFLIDIFLFGIRLDYGVGTALINSGAGHSQSSRFHLLGNSRINTFPQQRILTEIP
jgi:hypothetical protein